LDSPWARHPAPTLVGTVEQRLVEAFCRYAWGIDQNDIAQLRDSFTHDIAGEFPPLGHLEGNADVIGQLKAFRQSWPWMQHFGRPLNIEIDDAQTSASMIVGRVIPQRATTPDGRNLYGAHYQLRLRKDDGVWRIEWLDYRPGWVAEASDREAS
jgi:hypothetical protein